MIKSTLYKKETLGLLSRIFCKISPIFELGYSVRFFELGYSVPLDWVGQELSCGALSDQKRIRWCSSNASTQCNATKQ